MKRVNTAALLVAVLALVAVGMSPAFAHHRDGHEGGSTGSETTEANDGDADDSTDPNVDEDDNPHPSGKDRSTEGGASGNQGSTTSDPDDDGHGPDRSNGGPDKPGGSGGVDAADQDGNNGCGNDDDFEDDNEGWCGGKPKPQPTTSPSVVASGEEVCDKDVTMPGIQPCDEDEVVGGSSSGVCDKDVTMPGIQPCLDEDDDEIVSDTEVQPEVRVDQAETKVLGERLAAVPRTALAAAAEAAAGGAQLPFTGGELVPFVVLGFGLLGTGWVITRRDG